MNTMRHSFLIFILLKASVFLTANTGSERKKEKMHLSYNGGAYAPLGLMTGLTFSKGHGFYINARSNRHVLKKAQYYFDGTAISDHHLTWEYDDKSIYSRWEANAGGIIQLYKNEKGRALKLYAGAGILKPRYLYSFKKTAGNQIEHAWVEYREIGKFSYNTELGICFYVKESLTLQLGLSSLTKKYERMLTFGIGTGLYKHYH